MGRQEDVGARWLHSFEISTWVTSYFEVKLNKVPMLTRLRNVALDKEKTYELAKMHIEREYGHWALSRHVAHLWCSG